MSQTVSIVCNVNSAIPSGTGIIITYTLSNTTTGQRISYTDYFETALLAQGLTNGMNTGQKQTQVTGTFMTLTRSRFESFANQVKAVIGQADVLAGLGTSSVTVLSLLNDATCTVDL